MNAPVALTGAGNVTTATVTASATLVGNKPSAVADKDLLYALVGSRNSSGTWDTVPAGWILAVGQNSSGTTAIYVKPILSAAGEPATYTFHTTGGAARGGVVVGRITNANLNAPVDAAGTPVTSGTATIIAPAVTSLHVDTLLLGAFLSYLGSSTQPIITAPTGMTETAGVSITTGSATTYMEVCAQQVSAIGSTGSRTASVSPAGTAAAGLMVTIASVPSSAASLSSASSLTAAATTAAGVGANLSSASSMSASASLRQGAAAHLTSASSLSATAGVAVLSALDASGVWKAVTTYELVSGSWVQS